MMINRNGDGTERNIMQFLKHYPIHDLIRKQTHKTTTSNANQCMRNRTLQKNKDNFCLNYCFKMPRVRNCKLCLDVKQSILEICFYPMCSSRDFRENVISVLMCQMYVVLKAGCCYVCGSLAWMLCSISPLIRDLYSTLPQMSWIAFYYAVTCCWSSVRRVSLIPNIDLNHFWILLKTTMAKHVIRMNFERVWILNHANLKQKLFENGSIPRKYLVMVYHMLY